MLIRNEEGRRKWIIHLFASVKCMYIDGLIHCALSSGCFFVGLSYLRMSDLHRHLSFVSNTIQHVSTDLFAFSLKFFIIFTVFFGFFHFPFISSVPTYSIYTPHQFSIYARSQQVHWGGEQEALVFMMRRFRQWLVTFITKSISA